MKTIVQLLLAALIFAAPLRAATGSAQIGQSVTITVVADGSQPFTYQWKKAGQDIAGATAAAVSLQSVQLADAGVYTVQVSNSAGSILSDPATLTITGTPPTIRSLQFTISVPSAVALTLTLSPNKTIGGK